jgi:hypothetical protein
MPRPSFSERRGFLLQPKERIGTVSKTLSTTSALVVSLLLTIARQSSAQETKQIPVYPGAVLVTEKEPGTEPQCCSFTTHDSFDKVLSFYQTVLKSKPMDTRQLAAAYPEMRHQLQQLEQQMPPTMKYRAYVLAEMELNGRKGAILFEVISTPDGVKFTVPENSIGEKDAHFVPQWREQAGLLTVEEKAGKSIVDWNQLQAVLPATASFGDFKRGEVSGETNREGANPTSSVSVTYQKVISRGEAGEDGRQQVSVDLTITIEDAGNKQEYATDMTTAAAPNERATTVKGQFKGKEQSDKNESGYESCEIVFLVNNRFIVDCRGTGTRDLALLKKLIDGMNLERLKSLK